MDGVQISFDEKELERILDNALGDIERHTETVSREVADDTVRELKARSPGGGDYAGGWTKESAKSQGYDYGYIVWNEKHYQLTHLLEKGHAISNQYGSYSGRVRAIPHIGPTEKRMIPIYLKKIKDIKF